MVRNYQRKTQRPSSDRRLRAIFTRREQIDTEKIAEVLIRVALREAGAASGWAGLHICVVTASRCPHQTPLSGLGENPKGSHDHDTHRPPRRPRPRRPAHACRWPEADQRSSGPSCWEGARDLVPAGLHQGPGHPQRSRRRALHPRAAQGRPVERGHRGGVHRARRVREESAPQSAPGDAGLPRRAPRPVLHYQQSRPHRSQPSR